MAQACRSAKLAQRAALTAACVPWLQEEPEGGPTPDWCQRVCPNILDLKCSALRGCFGRLSKVGVCCVAPQQCRASRQLAWPAAVAL